MAQVLVLADDLTGGNAAGALFARRGLRTVVVRDVDAAAGYAAAVDVLVIDLATRHVPPGAARGLVAEALATLDRTVAEVRLVVKRVDTTLRGNVGAETEALVDAVAARAGSRVRALAVPAFPAAGRITVGGIHLVDGVPLAETAAAADPLDPVRSSRVATVLRAQTTRSVAEVPLDVVEAGGEVLVNALQSTAEIVVCDATGPPHLQAVADAAARVARAGTRWVSIDSGPFGVALAAALGVRLGAGIGRDAPPPILAVAGSVTDLTRDQIVATEQAMAARYVDVAADAFDVGSTVRAVGRVIDEGVTVAGVRLGALRGPARLDPALAATLPQALGAVARRLLRERRIGGLYVTGGDAAAAVISALEADGLTVETEIRPLAVAGRLVGGPNEGLPFVSKGGLVGDRTAAVACIEYLQAAARNQSGKEGPWIRPTPARSSR
ncbi:MAG: four-carbon acid sugar kinase family protein [Carbonactinosporaceae bacterium]